MCSASLAYKSLKKKKNLDWENIEFVPIEKEEQCL